MQCSFMEHHYGGAARASVPPKSSYLHCANPEMETEVSPSHLSIPYAQRILEAQTTMKITTWGTENPLQAMKVSKVIKHLTSPL